MSRAPDPPIAVRRRDCPLCGGALSEPISGGVHCFVRCLSCEEDFELDDPRLLPLS